jgi:hypothetical protein
MRRVTAPSTLVPKADRRLPPVAVLSRQLPFVTLHASDLGGPGARQRVLWQQGPVPSWLSSWCCLVGLGQSLVAVAMGRARLGSTTRIKSIISYAPTDAHPAFAHIYVEETELAGGPARSAAPIHVVRCLALPRGVRFVEVPSSGGQAQLWLAP